MTRLVVMTHRPWRTPLFVVLLVTVLALTGWSLFEYGRFRAGFDRAAAEQERRELQGARKALEARIGELREQTALLERASQVDRQAYSGLQETLRSLQDEILELKEELAFYRGIVSPRDAVRGLTVQSFKVEPSGETGRYRFKLVLTQVLSNDKLASGSVRLQLEGLQAGRQTVLSLAEISEKAVKELQYRFKYFENLEGDLLLPDQFVPLRVLVDVLPSGSPTKKIEKTFDWPAEENATHVG